MLLRLISLSFLFFSWMTGICQVTFNRIDSLDFVATIATSILETEDYYFVSGVYCDDIDSTNICGSFLNKFDKNFEWIDTYSYIDSTGLLRFEHSKPNLKLLHDGNLMLTGIEDKNFDIDPYLLKISPNGEIIYKKYLRSEFILNGFELDVDFIEYDDGSIITATRCQRDDLPQASTEICIYKFDANGNQIWYKTIENPTQRDYVGQLRKRNNGNIVLFGGGNFNHLGNPIMDDVWVAISEIDSSGQILSVWNSDYEELFYRSRSGIVTSEDEYVFVTGQRVNYNSGALFLSNPTVVKLDASFNKLWQIQVIDQVDTLFSPSIKYTQILNLESENAYIVVGQMHFGNIDDPNRNFSDDFGVIVKLNHDGSIIWRRYYQFFKEDVYFDDHEFLDVIQTSDSGFLACGESFNGDINLKISNKFQFSWLVKMDSFGCVVPGCQDVVNNVNELEEPINDLKVYPNPAEDVVNISFAELNLKSDLVLELVDLKGSVIKTYPVLLNNLTMIIDISKLSKGFYFFRLKEDGILLASEKIIKI